MKQTVTVIIGRCMSILACMAILQGTAVSPRAAEATRTNLFSNALQMSDTLRIGLHDALFLGLENNATVTIQRLSPDIANASAREQRAAFDPVFTLDGQQSKSKSSRRLGAQPSPFDLEDKRFDFTATITEQLPTGTSLSLSAGMTGSISNLYTDQYTGDLGITITQSLLRGFGPGPNLASLRQARFDVDISRWELKGVAENVAANIEKGYWDLYLAGRESAIQRKSLDLALQQLSESKERVAVGKLATLELASVEAEVAARRGALIDAQAKHEQAKLQFLYLLNPDRQSFWTACPVPKDEPFIPEDSLDTIETHEQLGMQYRPDMQQARLSLEKGNLEVQRTRNGLLPRLDVFISLGRSSYATSFQDAYPDISSPFYQVTAGATFELPVLNRQASAQRARARYSLEQQKLAVSNMERLVQLDVRTAYVEAVRSREQIEATRVTRELQEKKLAAELEKFRVGKSTNYLVLQAQRDFTASQLDEARSLVAYLDALIDIYVAEGTLLERREIDTFAN
jgi:outer membrane protein